MRVAIIKDDVVQNVIVVDDYDTFVAENATFVAAHHLTPVDDRVFVQIGDTFSGHSFQREADPEPEAKTETQKLIDRLVDVGVLLPEDIEGL